MVWWCGVGMWFFFNDCNTNLGFYWGYLRLWQICNDGYQKKCLILRNAARLSILRPQNGTECIRYGKARTNFGVRNINKC